MTREESIEELKSIQYQFQSSLEEAASEYAEEWQKESLQNNENAVKALDMAIKALETEPLTDTEQRIFLAAMGREEKVCKKVGEDLVAVCHRIKRKVKVALWE